jgi:hypothetical protein
VGCSLGSGPWDDRRQPTGDLRPEREPARELRICARHAARGDLNTRADRLRGVAHPRWFLHDRNVGVLAQEDP